MIELREAQFSDYTDIARLHADSWRKTYRGIFSDEFLNNVVEQDRIDIWYKKMGAPESNQLVTVAMQNENILGFSCLYFNDDPVFGTLLDNLHVTASNQGTGIGGLLMKAAARDISLACTSKKMYLWVFEQNSNAMAVYERWGGKKYETTEHQNADGSYAQACRYIWDDITQKLKI